MVEIAYLVVPNGAGGELTTTYGWAGSLTVHLSVASEQGDQWLSLVKVAAESSPVSGDG
jgi:hypothetical protein